MNFRNFGNGFGSAWILIILIILILLFAFVDNDITDCN